jgi:hypothetical protein
MSGGLTSFNSVVTKTQAYLEVFSRFKQRESVQAVERILAQQTDLVAFEKSQLGTYLSLYLLHFNLTI